MNKAQKEVIQAFLDNEKATLKQIEETYQEALDEIGNRIQILKSREDADMQHVIYQIEYQNALKRQVQEILDQLHEDEYKTVSEYLKRCYEDGYVGTLYDLQYQGVPILMPIDQAQVVAAIVHETKLSEDLYSTLGKDVKELQKKISSEISRGIANGQMYSEIARNISKYAGISKNNAMRIARTEGHRIQCKSTSDAQWKAKEHGADIVKRWDATLDSKTRPEHAQLDGQIRELEEYYEVAGYRAMEPSGFGVAAMDINCRCQSISKARWLLDADETKYIGDTSQMTDEQLEPIAKKLGMSTDELRQYKDEIIPVKAKNYEDFKQQYDKIWKFEGSDLQKEAEARIAGYKNGDSSVRSNVQKKNDEKIEYMRNNLPKGYNDERNVGKQISEKDFNQFMKYASENGVQIGIEGKSSGFETYCGNPEILYQMVDKAKSQIDSKWFEKTKTQKIILMYDNVLGYNGDNSKIDIGSFASTKGNTITLNKFMFDDSNFMKKEYEKLANEGYFVKGTDYRSIIDHETGHIIDKKCVGDRNKILKVFEEAANESGMSLDEFIIENISVYASDINETGYHELIPEVNSLLQNNGNDNIIKLIRKAGVHNAI